MSNNFATPTNSASAASASSSVTVYGSPVAALDRNSKTGGEIYDKLIEKGSKRGLLGNRVLKMCIEEISSR